MEKSNGGTARGVLWDLDGTLIDSGELHYEAWEEVLTELGRAFDRRTFAESFGKRNDTILRDLLGIPGAPEELQRLSDRKEELYRTRVRARGVPLLPGAAEWLHRLKAEGWRQALATSAPIANVDATLEPLGLRDHFDAVVSADEVGRGKPDPLVFLTAAERLGLPPGRCVVVEDAPAGLEGARRGGMPSIGVLSGHFEGLQADLVVGSLRDLPEDAFHRLLGGAA
jgi:beta-phosphoglucomutase family hydrolase